MYKPNIRIIQQILKAFKMQKEEVHKKSEKTCILFFSLLTLYFKVLLILLKI